MIPLNISHRVPRKNCHLSVVVYFVYARVNILWHISKRLSYFVYLANPSIRLGATKAYSSRVSLGCDSVFVYKQIKHPQATTYFNIDFSVTPIIFIISFENKQYNVYMTNNIE